MHNDIFRFGKHRSISLFDLKRSLENLLGTKHPLILVVHGGHRETSLLQKLDIDLSTVFVIDAAKVSRYPLQIFNDCTLKKLLLEFSIRSTGGSLHVAGNDAHFTLRALLMSAVADAQRELDEVPKWVSVFQDIAQAPLPPIPLRIAQKAAMKRRVKRDGAAIEEARQLYVRKLRSARKKEARRSSKSL